MANNFNETSYNAPKRHGWGGDLIRRDAVLKDRAEDLEERGTNGNKFAAEPVVSEEDYNLLPLMENGQEGVKDEN